MECALLLAGFVAFVVNWIAPGAASGAQADFTDGSNGDLYVPDWQMGVPNASTAGLTGNS